MARGKRAAASKPGADEGTEKQTNVKARASIIRSVCRELNSLERKRDALNGEIRELLHTKIKDDLDMPIADFRTAYRFYKLEDEKRDVFFDNLRETFEALGKGGQLDFIGDLRRTAGGAEEPPPPPAAAAPMPPEPERTY